MGFSKIGNFLNKKPWHPSNFRNQEAIWIAEQKAAKEARALEEYKARIRVERDAEELKTVGRGGFVMSQETAAEKRKAHTLSQFVAEESEDVFEPDTKKQKADEEEAMKAKQATDKASREEKKKQEAAARNAEKRRRKKESKARKAGAPESQAPSSAADAADAPDAPEPEPAAPAPDPPAAATFDNDGSFMARAMELAREKAAAKEAAAAAAPSSS